MIICAIPDCNGIADVGGRCEKHRRRCGPKRQDPWERLASAALDYADAMPGRSFDSAAEKLKRAAEAYQRSVKQNRKPLRFLRGGAA